MWPSMFESYGLEIIDAMRSGFGWAILAQFVVYHVAVIIRNAFKYISRS